jgi:hypothetical protein
MSRSRGCPCPAVGVQPEPFLLADTEVVATMPTSRAVTVSNTMRMPIVLHELLHQSDEYTRFHRER